VAGLVLADAVLGANGALGLVGITGDAQVSSPAGAAQPIAQLMRTRNAGPLPPPTRRARPRRIL